MALATLVLFLLLAAAPLSSSEMRAGGDLSSLLTLSSSVTGVGGEVCCQRDETLAFRCCVKCEKDRKWDCSLFSTSLLLDYHPFSNGFFLSFSLFGAGWFFGLDRPETRYVSLNELMVGYRFSHRWWYLEPKIVVNDPSGVFSDSYRLREQVFGDIPPVRFSCVTGVRWRW